jgi:predicted nucleotidyltransferase
MWCRLSPICVSYAMLFDPLDEILGRRSKVRLLRALGPLDRPVSGREAARLAGLSHRVITSLDELAALGVVIRREAAGQHLYTFNREHVLADAIQHVFAEEERRSGLILDRIRLVAAEAGALYAGVFGSAARKQDRPGSDLDVLMVVEHEDAKERSRDAMIRMLEVLHEEYGVRPSPVVLTLAEARRQAREDSSLLRDVLRDGRCVHGRRLEDLLNG